MKRTKLILYINVLLLMGIESKAQGIIDGTRYLIRSTWAGRYNIDTTQIISNTNDSLVFQIITPPYNKERKKRTFVKKNNIVSVVDADKMRPLYNYNLQEKDSFIASWAWGGDTNKIFSTTLYVDSIRYVKLLDNKLYKHWYFKRNTQSGLPIIWIENLGEAQLGWDYGQAYAVETFYGLHAICQNNSLTLNIETPRINSCNFDSLKKVDVAPINNTMETIALYPNPAQNKIFVTNGFSGKDDWQITIYNSQGILMKSTTINNTNDFIDVSDLSRGLYFITVNTNKRGFKQKVTIE